MWAFGSEYPLLLLIMFLSSVWAMERALVAGIEAVKELALRRLELGAGDENDEEKSR